MALAPILFLFWVVAVTLVILWMRAATINRATEQNRFNAPLEDWKKK